MRGNDLCFNRRLCEKKKSTPKRAFYGAGYGNRTRLCGLGSDHSTDELTLRVGAIIADRKRKFKPNLSSRWQFARGYAILLKKYSKEGQVC